MLMWLQGVEVKRNSSGTPYPGALKRNFLSTEVVALGKLAFYGDAVTRYLVRLQDGTELFVKACDQEQDAEKWLRKLARKVECPITRRETPVVLTWMTLSEGK